MWLLGIELRTLAHGIILPAQENTLFFFGPGAENQIQGFVHAK